MKKMYKSQLKYFLDLYKQLRDLNTKKRLQDRINNYDIIQFYITRVIMVLLIINILHQQCQMQHINNKVDNTTNNLYDKNFTMTTTESNNQDNNSFFLNMDKPKLGNAEFDFPEQKEIDDAVLFGLEKMHNLYFVEEPKLYKMGLFLKKNHPGHTLAFFRTYNEKSLEYVRYGYASVQASSKIAQLRAESKSRETPIPISFLRSNLLLDKCPLQGLPRCPSNFVRYRTIDGSCNNLQNLWFGASMLPMQRLLPPNYSDGIQMVRKSVLGGHLPSPREISVKIHKDKNREMDTLTLMFMQWGQFLDHDIIFSAQARMFNRSVPQCCQDDGSDFLPPDLTHPECLPIPVSEDDWFFGKFGIRCMEFVRSAPTSRIDCDLGWREQISQVTAYIDGSTVYGSDFDTSDSIRLFKKGQIAYGRNKRKGPLQPPDPPGGELCRKGAITSDCFQSGDFRINDQPGLTALHTVWLRYHNLLALELSKLNPHWSDEKIYQETRRIIGATIQHITYKEFLPIVLGEEVTKLFNLNLLNRGYYKGYTPKINAALTNAFGAAAFRFGHSLVQSSFVRTDSAHRTIRNNVTLHEEQENFENIWSFGSLDRLILGLCNQHSQKRDEFITSELTNHLFQSSAFPFGMDLAAINIQRGRDHGLPSYTAWREPCGLVPIQNWTDLEKIMSKETVHRFKSLYAHLDDIDLFSGGLAEKPVRGGIVGPTFACIIAQQFLNLRRGDRFWYENGNFESSFTPAQLQQIRQTTFAHVLCKSLSEIKTLQLFVFLTSDDLRNSRFPCDTIIDSLKLDAWEEVLEDSREVPLNLQEDVKDGSSTEEIKTEEPDELESRMDFEIFKKVRRRTTTTKKPQKTKKIRKRPVTTTTPQTNQKPFKVKLTNVTSTILNNKQKFHKPSGSNYNRPGHNQYPSKIPSVPQSSYTPSKPLTVLNKPSVDGYLVNYSNAVSPKPVQTISASSSSPINVNINIQLIPTKQEGAQQSFYQYDYKLPNNNIQKPSSPPPIFVLNKYDQNQQQQHHNNYPTYNSAYSTQRPPSNNFYAKYTYDQYGNLNIVSEKSHIKPLYGYSTSPTIFESIPFATSSKPHVENENSNDFHYNNEPTGKPVIIPSYLFLNENSEEDDLKDLLKPDKQTNDGQGHPDDDKDNYDGLHDFNSDISYLHMLHYYKNHAQQQQQQQQDQNNDQKFIKISSIKGQKYISNQDIHKPVLFSIKQREGDLDLSGEQNISVTPNSPSFKINIFPSEIRVERWKIYNETIDDFIGPSVFDLIHPNGSTSSSDELPRPIVIY